MVDSARVARLSEAMKAGRPCDFGSIDAVNAEPAAWAGREIDAKTLAERIKQASTDGLGFELNGAMVRGCLSLGDAKIEVQLHLTSCWLVGGLELDSAKLSDLDVTGSIVGCGPSGWAISGTSATVSGNVTIGRTRIDGGCQLAGVSIGGSLNGPDAVIDWNGGQARADRKHWAMDLTNATMGGDLDLRRITLQGGLSLPGAHIGGQLNLAGAEIARPEPIDQADPDNAELSEYTALWAQGSHIGESVLTYYDEEAQRPTKFTGYVSFVSAQVDAGANFSRVQFEAAYPESVTSVAVSSEDFGQKRPLIAVDLFNAKITSTLGFVDSKCQAGLQVDLRRCKVGTLVPGKTMWTGSKYAIYGLTYGAIDDTGKDRRDWLEAAVDGNKPGPYLQLAAAAHASGASSDELKAKIMASSKAANPLERALLGWVRYGYRPYLVIVPLVILAATAFFLAGDANDHGGFAPVVVNSKTYTTKTCDDAQVNCLNPALYAIESVIPVDQHQLSTWRPDRSSGSGGALFWIVTINGYAAWLFAGVFLAAVSGFLKRT